MRYHLYKKKSKNCWWWCTEIHGWLKYKTRQLLLENSLAVSQKVKYRDTIWSQNCTSSYASKKVKTICPSKKLYMNVHSSIIHNSQKVKITIQKLIKRWINKMWGVRIHTHTYIKANVTILFVYLPCFCLFWRPFHISTYIC